MDILERSYGYGSSPLPLDSTTTPLRVYLAGQNISHSLSPLLHSIMFKSSAVPWTYNKCDTTDPSQFQELLNDQKCIGTSITMPNKVTFRELLNDLTEEARVIGAVNTSFVRLDENKRRKHIGTNTDCIGIRESILQRAPQAITASKGRPALLIGGGGAARAAVFALWKWFQPSEIYIVNRFKSEVDTLIDFFKCSAPDIKLRHLATVVEAENLDTPRLIVGTIPDNPPKELDEILCRQICDTILKKKDKGVLVDMCYLPSPLTSLHANAEANGWKVIPGTEVLVRVCIAQQILWLERDVSEHGIEQALSAIRDAACRNQKRIAATSKL